jgi:hypothetical protein
MEQPRIVAQAIRAWMQRIEEGSAAP